MPCELESTACMNLHDAVTLDDPSPTENLNRVQRLSQSEFICLTIDLTVICFDSWRGCGLYVPQNLVLPELSSVLVLVYLFFLSLSVTMNKILIKIYFKNSRAI